MRIMVPAASAATNAMTRPSLDAWPAHGEQKHGQRQRNRHARDVEDVAKRVVGRRLLEPLRLLSERDKHDSSCLAS